MSEQEISAVHASDMKLPDWAKKTRLKDIHWLNRYALILVLYLEQVYGSRAAVALETGISHSTISNIHNFGEGRASSETIKKLEDSVSDYLQEQRDAEKADKS